MSASSVPMDVVRQATSSCPPATHILAELPYLPSAVPQARRVLREGIRLARLPEDVRGTAELLVSELVTNAVKYGEPPLWLFIEMRPGLIHASVSDTSTALPQRRTAAPDAEGGRGLLVLDALAGSWGTVAAEGGKYLWFDLPVPVVPPGPALDADGAVVPRPTDPHGGPDPRGRGAEIVPDPAASPDAGDAQPGASRGSPGRGPTGHGPSGRGPNGRGSAGHGAAGHGSARPGSARSAGSPADSSPDGESAPPRAALLSSAPARDRLPGVGSPAGRRAGMRGTSNTITTRLL
ncbi:Anti-sigma regulatory factor (Ser/Thr protein kinase) [Frankia canadensis]|uniref:Anti-sigma regulatory factor (Ser/Thr protein kinase) n=1 Tax=Frankia canadensis TaxID=1836972 RepID=A0A2I2KX90_9ACTN|nr:ATP-binding protein [Frankia canadensis]SNQ50277.1 Anti-sigma regulatory factor (Ser/Thr protein kinase) [Frankia canadensis]SOU57567.1 Anti-sigma regulatory factor (Ser/Thr protein kinase) [Frankia canadensis]